MKHAEEIRKIISDFERLFSPELQNHLWFVAVNCRFNLSEEDIECLKKTRESVSELNKSIKELKVKFERKNESVIS